MLHKNKGDAMKQNNYSPLALANCLAEVFTQIFDARAVAWCKQNNFLATWRASFREDYSCLDNMFTLNTIAQLKLKKKQGKMIYSIC